jgi:histidinol dehydrogenase
MAMIRRLNTSSPEFKAELDRLTATEATLNSEVDARVIEILRAVRERGDAALLEYTARFDGIAAKSVEELVISQGEIRATLQAISREERDALEAAADRIRQFHEKQKASSWEYTEADGTRLGQRVSPLSRVGLYVPGGRAAYPSSVLMNAMPAKIAGVNELIMVTPTPRGERNNMVLAAAAIAGVDRLIAIGGAQAVAALAYGTQSIAQVDKIVGPGNAYVASAKRHVFGVVGIDMIAGPSEILVICDGTADPDWVAMDLFSQAEHDEMAQSILLCPDAAFIDRVEASLGRLLPTLARKEIAGTSLADRGALILTKDLDEACELANTLAPEHLELAVGEPRRWLEKIHTAGAVFMGAYSSEVLGDYCAGPNHVLPTSRSARYASPLGVYDFQKRSSVIEVSAAGAQRLGQIATVLARSEGLGAHEGAARIRMQQK